MQTNIAFLTSSQCRTKSCYRQKYNSRRRLRISETSPEILRIFRYQEKDELRLFSLKTFLSNEVTRNHDTFHVSLLKPYTDDMFCREPQPEPAVLFDDGHEEFAVEKYSLIENTCYTQEHHKIESYADRENK